MEEKVLVFERKDIPSEWLQKRVGVKITKSDLSKKLGVYNWLERSKAEVDESVKQLIPYIILIDKESSKIGIYQRHGSEKRIHGLHSVGVGGHINIDDSEAGSYLIDIISKSAKRELQEELLGLPSSYECKILGIINEEETKVGRTHIGLVMILELDVRPDGDKELLNFIWETKKNILQNSKLELWSEMALKLIS